MNNGYTQQIRDRITNAPDGSVFVNSVLRILRTAIRLSRVLTD